MDTHKLGKDSVSDSDKPRGKPRFSRVSVNTIISAIKDYSHQVHNKKPYVFYGCPYVSEHKALRSDGKALRSEKKIYTSKKKAFLAHDKLNFPEKRHRSFGAYNLSTHSHHRPEHDKRKKPPHRRLFVCYSALRELRNLRFIENLLCDFESETKMLFLLRRQFKHRGPHNGLHDTAQTTRA